MAVPVNDGDRQHRWITDCELRWLATRLPDYRASSPLRKLLDFLDRLEVNKISYRLSHNSDSIMIELVIPGERWEVEFFEDGHVEVERFTSAGEIEDESRLEDLFTDEPPPDSLFQS
jgi:hypothetical protein